MALVRLIRALSMYISDGAENRETVSAAVHDERSQYYYVP